MSQPIDCPECDGTGVCPKCGGSGGGPDPALACSHCAEEEGTRNEPGKCPCCGGDGICFD